MLAEFDTMLMLVWSKSALVDVAWFPSRPPAMLRSDWWSCRLSLDINFISHCTRVTHQMSWSRERWCWLQCWPGLPHHQPVKQSDLMSPLLPGWAERRWRGLISKYCKSPAVVPRTRTQWQWTRDTRDTETRASETREHGEHADWHENSWPNGKNKQSSS